MLASLPSTTALAACTIVGCNCNGAAGSCTQAGVVCYETACKQCTADGVACTTNGQCCSGSCNTTTNKCANSGLPMTLACATGGQCESGDCKEAFGAGNGVCSCEAAGAVTYSREECCSGHADGLGRCCAYTGDTPTQVGNGCGCDDMTGVSGTCQQCGIDNASCTMDSQCCSGHCNFNGVSGTCYSTYGQFCTSGGDCNLGLNVSANCCNITAAQWQKVDPMTYCNGNPGNVSYGIPQCCVNSGSNAVNNACATDSQCCSQACENAKCCANDGTNCSHPGDCCSGACNGGKCTCLAIGVACTHNADCCPTGANQGDGFCDQNTHKCSCAANGVGCFADTNCCSGECRGGQCVAAACVGLGGNCDTQDPSTDCCPGTGGIICSNGKCCGGTTAACVNNTDCCSGSCTGPVGSKKCAATGATSGQYCAQDSDCAGGDCDNGRCCVAAAGNCNYNADCCSEVCSGLGGTCTCQLKGVVCESNAQCCSGSCTGQVGTGSGTCTCSATGQKCGVNGDCCAGLTCQANKTCG